MSATEEPEGDDMGNRQSVAEGQPGRDKGRTFARYPLPRRQRRMLKRIVRNARAKALKSQQKRIERLVTEAVADNRRVTRELFGEAVEGE